MKRFSVSLVFVKAGSDKTITTLEAQIVEAIDEDSALKNVLSSDKVKEIKGNLYLKTIIEI